MKHITDKGFAFYIDLSVAVITMFLSIFLITAFFGGQTENKKQEIEKIELETTAIFLADSIAKNNEKGCAEYNSEKKRVESGEILSNCLEEFEGKEFGKVYLAKVTKRFLKIDKKEEVIELVFCELEGTAS